MVSPAKKTIEIPSYAKLNLFLDVVGKRPDCYHDLVTLFERIDLCDTVRLRELSSNEIVIKATGEPVPTDSGNLAYKAADLIKRSQGLKAGIKIEIDKKIPVGAGLAGGSSNAASVLLGINRLFNLKLSARTLITYANRLGSDVAFFVYNRPFAMGRGRGGELRPVTFAKNTELWHLLFSPDLKVFTKDVYGLLDREKKASHTNMLTKKQADVNILLSCLKKKDLDLLNQSVYNRLSETVMKSYRLVSDLRSDLLDFGLKYVHMSGSGPTLFSIFKTKKEANSQMERLSCRFKDRCRIFLVSTAK